MGNTAQDEIYRSFVEAAQQRSEELSASRQSLADLILQADEVRRDAAPVAAGKADAQVSSSSRSRAGSQPSGDGSPLSGVLNVFKSGLGISPLIKGVLGLFGGGDSPSPPPLVKYALPPAIHFQAAEVGGGVTNLDYGQSGLPRSYSGGGAGAATSTAPVTGAPAATPQGAPQISVHVQAMDARSFMDRSSDIAAAVRDAMLNLNSINDVVNDL
jgi:hypothetical protein